MSAFSSSVFNKSFQSTEKESRIKFSQPNLDQSFSYRLDLLPEILPNVSGIIENWGRWSEMVAVKLPDIMSGSMTFENELSTRVLRELKVRGPKNSFVWLCSL